MTSDQTNRNASAPTSASAARSLTPRLKHTLIRNGLDPEQASRVAPIISHCACAIKARHAGTQIRLAVYSDRFSLVHVTLCVVWNEKLDFADAHQVARIRSLSGEFTRDVQFEMQGSPAGHIRFFSPDDVGQDISRSFEEMFREEGAGSVDVLSL